MSAKKRPATRGADPSSGLDDTMRGWMVVRFAVGMSPTQVAEALEEEFGVKISKVQANRYNFNSPAGSRETAQKWKTLFDEAHERFLDDIASVPMANKTKRLHQLQFFYDRAREAGQDDKAREILEQIAKEVGNVHSSERTIHHKGKIAVEEQPQSIEELRNLLADRIAESFEKDPVKPTAPGSGTTQ